MTNEVLIMVLSQILNVTPLLGLPDETVKLENLPKSCQAAYDAEMKEIRQATTTQVSQHDIDGDGRKEWLVWNGDGGGSGGLVWSVLTTDDKGEFSNAGTIEGDTFICPNGILACWNGGWENATWTYHELRDGKLVELYEINATYAPSQKIYANVKELEVKVKQSTAATSGE